MTTRRALLLVLLVPALLYGAAKGLMYYNARQAIDRIVEAAAGEADIGYAGISTDLRGAVSIEGITVQPRGRGERFSIERVRVASDDLWFFLRGGDLQTGANAPPQSLSLRATNVALPLSDDLLALPGATPGQADAPCDNGLQIDPALLRTMGFDGLRIDMDASYRLDEARQALDLGMQLDLRDIQSMRVEATLTDVDMETLAQGAPPNLSLGRLAVAVRVAPAFGGRALEACADGTGTMPSDWGDRLAARSIGQFEQAGLGLGSGLRQAVHDFYRDWGEIEIVAAPARPVGLLSLMFLPPDQLANALSLRLSLNGKPVPDTRFTWQRPNESALVALQRAAQAQPVAPAAVASNRRTDRTARTRVTRAFETVPVTDLAGFVEQRVRLTPRGMPTREGVLKGVANGVAEVEQSLHGGTYTAFVALDDIESAEALVQREVGPVGGQ